MYMNIYDINDDILKKRYTEQNVVEQVGILGYLGIDIQSSIKEMIPVNKKKFLEQADIFYQEHTVKAYEFENKKKVKNVILIQLEGVDSVALDLKVDGKPVMKNLSELKSNGIWFPNVYDQTGSGRTSDGEFLALTSLLPIEGESMYTHYDLSKILSLPKYMKRLGYTTVALHGNDSSYWNRKNAHKALGYDERIYGEDSDGEIEKNYEGWGLSDGTMLNETLKVLKTHVEPMFTHTILLTSHHPYTAVRNMDIPLPYEQADSLLKNYINCLYYMDDVIGKFVSALQENALMEKSILIIFADHDSGLTEDVYRYMNLEYNVEDPNCDKVPLIIYDGVNNYTDLHVQGQSDVMPIILSYLDIQLPDKIMGANYINNDKIVYLRNCIMNDYKEASENPYQLNNITKLLVTGELNEE